MGEMGITRSDYLISITVIVVTTAGLFGFLTAGLFLQQSCGFLSPSNTAMVLLISPDFLSVQKPGYFQVWVIFMITTKH